MLSILLSSMLVGAAEPEVAVVRGEAAPVVPVEPLDDGTAVERVHRLRPVLLTDTPLVYDHLEDQPRMSAVLSMVIEVDPAYAVPREDGFLPVLYAGAVPVKVLARDTASGCLVAVAPPETALSLEPLFFGSRLEATKVDDARGQAELGAALAKGVRPRTAEEVATAREAGGKPLGVADPAELDAMLTDLTGVCGGL